MCTCWLPFLPGSTSALVAVFLAGLTFGFILFPVAIFYYFSFIIILIFLIFIYYYLFIVVWLFLIFVIILLFLTSTEVDGGVCSSVERLAELGDVFVVCSVPTSPHLQALRVLSIAVVPCPGFWCFPYFSIFFQDKI